MWIKNGPLGILLGNYHAQDDPNAVWPQPIVDHFEDLDKMIDKSCSDPTELQACKQALVELRRVYGELLTPSSDLGGSFCISIAALTVCAWHSKEQIFSNGSSGQKLMHTPICISSGGLFIHKALMFNQAILTPGKTEDDSSLS
ncbi:hypothetical protein AC579_171 [Pseudocercospora musae]|uniref:Uncharacterized protein n=1 Tax=Pseudocercospora musae TaxID=113226 RepID=A0A139IAB1_9PEZI|nr:hypothetical protein AC579_171 [Pseudocercospora musae]